MTELRQLKKWLLDRLVAAQDQRDTRTDWIDYERDVMIAGVKYQRALRNRETTDEHRREVIRAEGLASGHSDYSAKFALYCAEIALYERVCKP